VHAHVGEGYLTFSNILRRHSTHTGMSHPERLSHVHCTHDTPKEVCVCVCGCV
jgi:hypothetical protein